MEKLNWIKELVLAEQQMEESGVVDFSAGFDAEAQLEEQTVEFLGELKAAFVEAASAFNQMKGSTLGNLKIYGISKTKADFMLFRNGFKLIFSMQRPGAIAIRFNTIGTNFLPGSNESTGKEDWILSHWGPFGELKWTYKDEPINMDYLVRHYVTRFVRESAK